MSDKPLADLTFRAAFESDTDFQKYGANALLLYALTLYLRVEDLEEFAVESLTDGGDDKKVDVCYLDLSEGFAIIGQGYFSQKWGKKSARANKASDLNTAISWLLSAHEDRVPANLQPKALELRRALREGEIKRIEILYVHNCFESDNVEKELKTVASATRDILGSWDAEQVVVSHRELGISEIEELYRSRDSDILVDDWIDVPGQGLIHETGAGWNAIVTSVDGNWVRNLYRAHGNRLFSANFRDYLGAAERQGNINLEIKQTAASEPINFWVYNNGITALTHELQPEPGRLRIHGISVINGAQTSGALGESSEAHAKDTRVLCRIVECAQKDLIPRIILYNNTQNAIKPADMRSKDQVQKRLRQGFSQYGITYVHRRSEPRTPRNAVTAATVGKWLCSFHGDLQTATRKANDIFLDDDIYGKIFRTGVCAEHVYLVTALSQAIDSIKYELKVKTSEADATESEKKEYEVLKYSLSKHFVLFLVGNVAEEIMQARVTDLYEWKCKPEVITSESKRMINAWSNALHALLPQIALLVACEGSAYDVTRSLALSKKVADGLKALLRSLESALGIQFTDLREKTTV